MANDQGTLLCYRNWVEDDDVVFTTLHPESGSRTADNLATTQSDDFWRVGGITTGSTSATVTAEFSADRDVEVVTAQFPRSDYPGVTEAAPNFAAADTIQWRLLDDVDAELYDSTVLASGVETGYMTAYHELPSLISARKLEVTFDGISRDTAGFFDVGNIGAWSKIEPVTGFAYPANFGWRTNQDTQRTPAGRLYTSRFDPLRRWSLIFDTLSNAESLIFDEMIRYSAGSRQVFVKRGDLPAGKNAMHAIILSARDMESTTMELRKLSMSFEEFI